MNSSLISNHKIQCRETIFHVSVILHWSRSSQIDNVIHLWVFTCQNHQKFSSLAKQMEWHLLKHAPHSEKVVYLTFHDNNFLGQKTLRIVPLSPFWLLTI